MVPHTMTEKIITILLIFIGVFIFSTITGAISSFLTDRLLDEDEEDIKLIINNNFNTINAELKKLREENKKLNDEIHDLKKLIKDE